MTPEQFAGRAVGLRWARWRADWRAVDCYGLVVLYFREVLGIDLGEVPRTDIVTGFDAARCWQRCGPESGAVAWMAFSDGAPAHCGLLLPGGDVLHAHGSEEMGGSVRVHSMAVIERLFGEVRFYRYTRCS